MTTLLKKIKRLFSNELITVQADELREQLKQANEYIDKIEAENNKIKSLHDEIVQALFIPPESSGIKAMLPYVNIVLVFLVLIILLFKL